uniref:Uncharacterized protein n=1 Tax=Anguilla anguilla TaxID=7936 RepID=A0A0E9TWV3_ANGAN
MPGVVCDSGSAFVVVTVIGRFGAKCACLSNNRKVNS